MTEKRPARQEPQPANDALFLNEEELTIGNISAAAESRGEKEALALDARHTAWMR